jgi:Glycosyltransferases involved in cell wall biogenesis
MVKDEEKNLERCLNSIRPLMENVDSELIIVDTGSKDRTVEIANNFTDKVYFHPWNNNFSEMRNITLSYAQGKWVFVIDADEEVVDATALMQFLEVGDKNIKVGACLVSVQSVLNENDSSQKSEFVSPRIFRNTKELKYTGVIHNLPIYTGKAILLNLTLKHYGYVATDKELMEKKFQRTKTLLEQELTKDPQNIYYRFQLSASYSMHNDKSDALIHAIKAYDLVKENGLDPKPFIYLYGHIVYLYLFSENLEKAEQFCLEGLELEREHLDLHLYLAQIKQANNDIDSAIIHYQEYLNLVDHFQELEVRKNRLVVFNQINNYTQTALNLSGLYCNLARYDQATALLTKLNLNRLPDQIHIKIFAKSFMNSGEFQKLKALYTSQDVKDKIFFQKVMENNYKLLNPILKRKFLIAFSDDYKNDDYLKLQRLRFLFSNSYDNESRTLLIEFANTYDFDSGLDIYGEIVYYLFKLFIPIEKILNKVSELNILEYLKFLSRNFQDFNVIIGQYTRTMETSNSISELRTFKILYKVVLDVLENPRDFNRTFFSYVYFGLKYIKRVYHDEIIKSEMTVALKNNEDSFLVYLSLALELDDKDQRSSFLRKAINFYPEMARGVELLLDDKFLAWTQEKELKAQLNILMGLQEYDSVNQVINEYKLIHGNVLDIDFHSIQGTAYIYLNQLEKANEVLLEGLAIDPSNVDILFNLGYLNRLVGNFNKAIDYYIKAKGNCLNPEIKLQIEQQLAEIDKMMIQDEQNHIIVISKDIDEELIESVEKFDSDLSIDLALLGSLNTNYDFLFRKIVCFNKLESLLEYINRNDYRCLVSHELSVVRKYLQNQGIRIYNNFDEVINCLEVKLPKNTRLIEQKPVDLTIVIPTYNRPEYLGRLLNYIKNYKTINPYLIVLDSSEPIKRMKNKSLIDSEPFDQIEYYEFDSTTDFMDKTYFGIKKVKTEYMCFCADDDYLTEEGLSESLNLLSRNNNFFSVKGKNLYYIHSENRMKEYDFFNGAYGEDPIERIQDICQGFVPSMWYQVFRTAQYERLYRFCIENREGFPQNPTFCEYLFYFMILASGKIAKGVLDLNIRNKGIKRESYVANFPDALIDRSFNENYLKLRENFTKYLNELNYIYSGLEARIDTVFISFLNNFLAIPSDFIKFKDDKFDLGLLLEGCKQSWVWPNS